MRTRQASLLTVLTLVLATGCGDDADGDAPWVGYVEAEYVYAAAPQSGWITAMPIREGDAVAVGDTLFTLDDEQERAALAEAAARVAESDARVRDLATGARREEIAALNARVAETEADFQNAETELKRAEQLIARGAMPPSRGDQLTAARDAARARLAAAREEVEVAELAGRDAARDAAAAGKTAAEAAWAQAQWRIEQRSVHARAAGRVERVLHRQGEFVTAGAPVVAVLPETGLKVRFFAPQAHLAGLEPGAAVTVMADGLAQPIEARISYIAQEAEFTPPVIYSAESRDTLVFALEARLPAGATLRPGLPVDVSPP